MKKWITSSLILVILLFANKANSQIISQTYIDPCDKKVYNVTFAIPNQTLLIVVRGKSKIFTYTEAAQGRVQAWITQIFSEPCPINVTVQQSIQTAVGQAATQAASQAASGAVSQAASSAASNAAASAASSTPLPPPPTAPIPSPQPAAAAPPPTSGAASGATSPPPSTSASSSSSTSSGSSSSSQSSSSSGSGSSSSSSTENKSSSTETKTEAKTEEKKTETKTEEKKSEQKEEKKEEQKEEKKEEKKKEEKKKVVVNPMLLSADFAAAQTTEGGVTPSINLGISQSSATGEDSWGITGMLILDFKSVAVSFSKTDMNLKNGMLTSINSYSSTIAYLSGIPATINGFTHIVPKPKYTYGYNVSAVMIKLNISDVYSYSLLTSTTGFITKPFPVSKKVTISPSLFIMATPYTYSKLSGNTFNYNIMTLAGANYSFVLSKKFNFSFDYKFSYGTTSGTQFLNYIQIGSKLVL